MNALDRDERLAVAAALDLYIDSLTRSHGESIEVALGELIAVKHWWGEVLAGVAEPDDLSEQAVRWVMVALRFYVTFGETSGEIPDDVAKVRVVLDRLEDDGLAAAA